MNALRNNQGFISKTHHLHVKLVLLPCRQGQFEGRTEVEWPFIFVTYDVEAIPTGLAPDRRFSRMARAAVQGQVERVTLDNSDDTRLKSGFVVLEVMDTRMRTILLHSHIVAPRVPIGVLTPLALEWRDSTISCLNSPSGRSEFQGLYSRLE